MAKPKSKQWKQERVALRRGRKLLKRHRSRFRLTGMETVGQIDESTFAVRAPRYFALESDWHDHLAIFLSKLRGAFASSLPVVLIDFREAKKMVAGGTLLFFCELNRLIEIFPQKIVRCIPARDEAVNQVLTHLGVYNTCGYQSSVVPTRKDVVTWQTSSSDVVDGKKVGVLIENSLNGDLAKQAFRGASEAMINCVNHAYEAPRRDGLPSPPTKKWWMFCRQDLDENQLFIAVCDLGIGIPRSLPLKYPSEVIKGALDFLSPGKRQTDSRMIQAAIEIARTRTDRQGRGLGLHNLKRIIDDEEQGMLYIFSNAGLVRYFAGSHMRANFHHSILGTVVVWSIPLTGKS